jgi:hypothetical protein
MQHILPRYLMLAMIGATLTACSVNPGDMNGPSRGIQADIDAAHWNGPTLDNPGETADFRGEPKGAIPWHAD